MTIIKKNALLVATIMLASSCTHENVGSIVGGSVGALAGSQIGGGTGRIVSTAIGTMIGAKIGGAIGKRLSQKDEQNIKQAANIAVKKNQAVSWHNEKNTEFHVRPMPAQSSQKKQVKVLIKEEGGEFKESVVNVVQHKDGSYSFV